MGMIKREKKSSSSLSTSPCAQLRAAYHNCFNRWYSEKFVKGQWDKEGCVSEWQKYRACLSEHLDDKHLSRFLEAEGFVDSFIQADLRNPVDGVSQVHSFLGCIADPELKANLQIMIYEGRLGSRC